MTSRSARLARLLYGLRTRLIALVLLALLPSLALILLGAREARQREAARIEQDALTLVQLAAAYAGNVLLLRPVNALVRAAQRMAAGHTDVQTGLAHDASELGQLAQAFDEMAAAVHSRTRSLAESEERFRWSAVLQQEQGPRLEPAAQEHLQRIRDGVGRMHSLIESLLQLSRVGRAELRREPLDLSELASLVAHDLQQSEPGRRVSFTIPPSLAAHGDPALLRVVLENLLGNAWKFTRLQPEARITFGLQPGPARERVFFVRDNGAGFGPAFMDRLFGPFQRLHRAGEFHGTGIGRVTVQRIIHRHGGRVWAEGEPGRGATFYFTL